MAHWEFEAIGTHWGIDCELSAADPQEVFAHVQARIETYDKNYSRFRSDSLVCAMAAQSGVYEMPADWDALWGVYEKLYTLTDGAFTPLVGSLLEDLGYDAAYSLLPKAQVRAVQNLSVVAFYKAPLLRLSEPALLDIGAGGKGHLVDIVSELLAQNGALTCTINAGGDIVHLGPTPLRVGLENPFDPSQAVGVIELGNESICGSSGNRRRLGPEHHIVDPRTGHSPANVAATWVIAKSGLIADALATAVYLVPPEQLQPHFDFEWAILANDHSVRYSPRFAGAFF